MDSNKKFDGYEKELLDLPAMRHEDNLPYLPKPNQVDVVITSMIAKPALTPTAFALPFLPDGSCMFARNRRRGIEIPGGHVQNGETLEEAAIREVREETGCKITKLIPIGFIRSMILGGAPKNYIEKYPTPLAFQQFYAAIVEETADDYRPNNECLRPIALTESTVDNCLGPHRRSHAAFYKTATGLLFPKKKS